VQNIPPEWKIIFQKAGITDEQLQDKKQMKVVKKFMKQNAALVNQHPDGKNLFNSENKSVASGIKHLMNRAESSCDTNKESSSSASPIENFSSSKVC
jgi:hypothetical protein